jgi:hypothetical protein
LALINRAVNSERPLASTTTTTTTTTTIGTKKIPTVVRLPVKLMPEEFGTTSTSASIETTKREESPTKRSRVM